MHALAQTHVTSPAGIGFGGPSRDPGRGSDTAQEAGPAVDHRRAASDNIFPMEHGYASDAG